MFDVRKGLLSLRWGIAALAIAVTGFTLPTPASAQVSGAIFTTTSIDGGVTCTGVDLNIYGDRQDVYLDGGPRHLGAGTGLPPGNYYVKVTEPDGTLLGYSTTASVVVSGGEFATCYQLWSILVKNSDGLQGYDLTTNNGGEYKVWISQDPNFANSASKTDNFKVDEEGGEGGGGGGAAVGTLIVQKFYDANANGAQDVTDPVTEPFLEGWMVNVRGVEVSPGVFSCINEDVGKDEFTTYTAGVEPGTCVVKEYMPTETNWIRTLPATTDTISVSVPEDGTATATFGNLCLGADHGHTLGFWSNKNGRALIETDLTGNLAALSALNLVDANGSPFNPITYAEFRTWILGAKATNMAYMLSAQLAAMQLNVMLFGQDINAIIYAPGTGSANALGFATLSAVMTEANTELGLHPVTMSGSAFRALQEALKDALDDANNNLNFVQGTPCAFTFPD